MKKINSIQFIDSLAEITRHRDREIIEHSLLKTLREYEPSQDYWLYKILATEPDISLGLLAYASQDDIVTAEYIRKQELPNYLMQPIIEVIETKKIIAITEGTEISDKKVLYPAFDSSGDIFAVLIQSTNKTDFESQHLIHGFLRIYSNYLELIEITKRDKLTSLLNRETLDSEIIRILIQNNNTDHSLAPSVSLIENDQRQYKGELNYWLGVLDIDFFKSINDNYGHLYGDEILILIARLMEQSVRDHDMVFRYGGEEFVIILKAYDRKDAVSAFERIRKTIAHHNYAQVDGVTVSIGVRQVLHQTGPVDVISEADTALYYAKKHGRNQIRVYETLVEEGNIEVKSESFESGEISFF